MKINELMRGDFLRYKQNFPDTLLQRKIVKVCGISGRVDVRTIDDDRFHESEHPNWLEPIPLTPEILEKNGLPQYQWIKIYLQGEYGNITDFSKEIKYVHQLQHILRLCGLDDLADNLKI